MIKSFGANSIYGFFARYLIDHSASLIDLDKARNVIQSIINSLKEQKIRLNSSQIKKIEEMLKRNGTSRDPIWREERWALYYRPFIGTCTNHCESAHSKINARLKKYEIPRKNKTHRIFIGLRCIIEYSLDHVKNVNESYGRHIIRHQEKLAKLCTRRKETSRGLQESIPS